MINLITIRQKLRRVPNPVGLMLAGHLLAPDYSEFMPITAASWSGRGVSCAAVCKDSVLRGRAPGMYLMSAHWLADRTKSFERLGNPQGFRPGRQDEPTPSTSPSGSPTSTCPRRCARQPSRRSKAARTAMRSRKACPHSARNCTPACACNTAHDDRELFVTCGTSGGLMLAMLVLLNPGEEVDRLRSVLRDVRLVGDGGRCAGGVRGHVSGFPHRRGPRGRGDHPAHED